MGLSTRQASLDRPCKPTPPPPPPTHLTSITTPPQPCHEYVSAGSRVTSIASVCELFQRNCTWWAPLYRRISTILSVSPYFNILLLSSPLRGGGWEETASTLKPKSLYKAKEWKFQWSPWGNAILVLNSQSVNRSVKSYYISLDLYLLLSRGGGKIGRVEGEGQALLVTPPCGIWSVI